MCVGREPEPSDIQLHKSFIKNTTATNKTIAILCEGERQAGPDMYTDLPSETHFTAQHSPHSRWKRCPDATSILLSHHPTCCTCCRSLAEKDGAAHLLPSQELPSHLASPPLHSLLLAQGSSEVPPPAALTLRKASRWALPHRTSHQRAGRQERAKQIRARTPLTSQENRVSQQAASPFFPLRDSEALPKTLLPSSPLYPLFSPSFPISTLCPHIINSSSIKAALKPFCENSLLYLSIRIQWLYLLCILD